VPTAGKLLTTHGISRQDGPLPQDSMAPHAQPGLDGFGGLWQIISDTLPLDFYYKR